MIRVAFKTLGCKVNTYETNLMREKIPHNFVEVDFNDEADVYIINTCSVTHIADKKTRQMINKAKKQNPDSIVVACGCFVNNLRHEAKFNKNFNNLRSNADVYLLNEEKSMLWDQIKVLYPMETRRKYNEIKNRNNVRGFLKIEDGCENFCSYCVIPYLRGKVKVRERKDIIKDAKKMVKNGIKEIVLTGINITACGSEYIYNIIKDISKIGKLKRIRIGSIEQSLISEDFLIKMKKLYRVDSKFCPEFHLSLQSGSDNVLILMNRYYTTKEYKEKVELIRKYYPDASITTDIIVGFPGETEKDFNDTLHFIKDIKFLSPHIFPYSKRVGTKAYEYKDEVSDSEKEKRVKILTYEAKMITRELLDNDRKNNKRYDILVEDVKRENDRYILVGHTKSYKKVYVPIDNSIYKRGNPVNRFVGKEILVDILDTDLL